MAHTGSGGTGTGSWRIGQHRGKYVAVRGQGYKRERRSLGTDDEGEALSALAELNQLTVTRAIDQSFTVRTILEHYIKARRPFIRTSDRQESQAKNLNAFFGGYRPNQVNEDLCRKYEIKHRTAGKSPSTVHTELQLLRTAFTWAVKKHHISRMPDLYVGSASPPRTYRLYRDDVPKLIAAAKSPHIALFIQLAISTAGRAGAILDLTWDRVDLNMGIIALHNPKRGETKKGRATIPVNDGLKAALTEAKRAALTPYVIEFNGKRVDSIKKAFQRTADRAGLPKCGPHTLRHTAACLMAEAGISMSVIAQYLGHSNTSITERIYARYSPTYLREASNVLSFD
jgi:integrase